MATRLKDIPLWTPKWTPETLRARKGDPNSGGERAYRRGFELQAISDGEMTFPGWASCRRPGVRAADIRLNGWPKIVGVDLSGPGRPGNAISVVAVEPGTWRRHLVDILFGNWRSHELAARLARIEEQYSPFVYMVENNGYQQSLIDWIKAARMQFWPKIEPTTTGTNKNSLAIGLPALQVEFENAAWSIPWGEYETHPIGHTCDWCRLDDEFRNHPTAMTSDGVMSVWFARQGIDEHVWFPSSGDGGMSGLDGFLNR